MIVCLDLRNLQGKDSLLLVGNHRIRKDVAGRNTVHGCRLTEGLYKAKEEGTGPIRGLQKRRKKGRAYRRF